MNTLELLNWSKEVVKYLEWVVTEVEKNLEWVVIEVEKNLETIEDKDVLLVPDNIKIFNWPQLWIVDWNMSQYKMDIW
jgi:hypothetical protein